MLRRHATKRFTGPFADLRFKRLRLKASPFNHNSNGRAVGAATTRIADILECGEPGVLLMVQRHRNSRFGGLKLQMPQDMDSPVAVTKEEATDELELMPTSAAEARDCRR